MPHETHESEIEAYLRDRVKALVAENKALREQLVAAQKEQAS